MKVVISNNVFVIEIQGEFGDTRLDPNLDLDTFLLKGLAKLMVDVGV